MAKKETEKVNKSRMSKNKTVDMQTVEETINKKLKKIKPEKQSVEKQEIHFSLFEVILLIIITILSCILISYFIAPKSKSSVSIDIADEDAKRFLEQYQYIIDNYYGDLNKNQLIDDAIKGMLSSLDMYSEIINSDSNTFSITLTGQYNGVGIVISNDESGNIVIEGVYKDTPAYRAGIKVGDIVSMFNGVSLNGVSTSKLVDMIASNDNMELTIVRNGTEFLVHMKKENIVLQSVSYKMLENNTGYISVDVFALNTPTQFNDALKALESQNMKSLIIDLRSNTGGHLAAVDDMLNMLVSKKHVIYQLQDKTGITKVYSRGEEDKSYKIVVLQNGASASASEIMSASLKENLNAYVIGNNSYGKGTVQTLVDASDDLSYKVTTKRWLTPNGNWINGVGVEPDLEISLTDEYYQNPGLDTDNQLKAAIDYLK